jgi:hypothetical protein
MQCIFWPPDLDVFGDTGGSWREGGKEGGKEGGLVLASVGAGTGIRRARDSGLDDRALGSIVLGNALVVLGELQYYRG